jgi:hypothetical protein
MREKGTFMKENAMKKTISILVIIALISIPVLVGAYAYPRSALDQKPVLGTNWTLGVIDTLYCEFPIFGNQTVTSVGQDNLIFNANGTGYTKQFISHTMSVTTTTLTGGTLSLAGNSINLPIGTYTKTYSTTTDSWYYTIDEIAWRIYSYSEGHVTNNYLKNSGGTILTTVTDSATIAY